MVSRIILSLSSTFLLVTSAAAQSLGTAESASGDQTNQCCVEAYDKVTKERACFCQCPGHFLNTPFGSLQCQMPGTVFYRATNVTANFVKSCDNRVGLLEPRPSTYTSN